MQRALPHILIHEINRRFAAAGPPGSSEGSSARPRFNLQPRSIPVPNSAGEPAPKPEAKDGEQSAEESAAAAGSEDSSSSEAPAAEPKAPATAAAAAAAGAPEEKRPAPTPVPAANIFGAARPVDTAAREREIEERLAKSAEARAKDDG